MDVASPDGGDWGARARAVIPGGASTGSKRPAALYGDADSHAPTHFVSASGCQLVTTTGAVLTDFTMALGSVALGYAEPRVTAAAKYAAAAGNVAGLPHASEVEVAERLCALVPCAEQVRFMKSGAEGVAAAVRIARTATGRDVVLGSGYFGWLDWCSDAAGVPANVRADFVAVPYDDVAALQRAADEAGTRLAAIVLEPVVERLPSPEWIASARAICDRLGAVLIFDEVKTGFRLHAAGYHGLTGTAPHLAVYGKALANGYPLSAVVGQRAVMEAASRSWISSTLSGESIALAAAGAVLDIHQSAAVCEGIWRAGERQMAIAARCIRESGRADVHLAGIAPMWFLRTDDPLRETTALESMAAAGVLLKRGAYNFPSTAHDGAAEEALAAALMSALRSSRPDDD